MGFFFVLLLGLSSPRPAAADVAACMCACGHHLPAPCGPADCMEHACSQHGNCPSGDAGAGAAASPELFFIQQLTSMVLANQQQEAQRRRLLEVDATANQARLAEHREKLLAERDQLLRQLIGPKLSQKLNLKPIGRSSSGLKLKSLGRTSGGLSRKPVKAAADPGLRRAAETIDCLLGPLLSRVETRPLASDVKGDLAKALRELSAEPPSGRMDEQKIYVTHRDTMIQAGGKESQVLLEVDLHRKEGTGVLVVDVRYGVKGAGSSSLEGDSVIHISPSGEILWSKESPEADACLGR